MRTEKVSFAGKEVTIRELRVGELEELVAKLFPASGGKLAEVQLDAELKALDWDVLYRVLPALCDEITADDVKQAYLSEVEELVAAWWRVCFTGLQKALVAMRTWGAASRQA